MYGITILRVKFVRYYIYTKETYIGLCSSAIITGMKEVNVVEPLSFLSFCRLHYTSNINYYNIIYDFYTILSSKNHENDLCVISFDTLYCLHN